MQKSIVTLAALMLCAAGSAASADSVLMDFDTSSGQPIASGLPNPETWVYLGTQTIPGKMQTMMWVKPTGVPPREVHKDDQTLFSKAIGMLGKARENYAGDYSESYEYQDLRRPKGSPQQFFEAFKQQQLQSCPTGTVTLISVSATELLLQATSGGCERFGDQDEIDRFLFGKRDMFHMVYMVKARAMTTEQRESGIRAVSTWSMGR